MMARLGVEVGTRTMRGVRLEGWFRSRARVVEVECDPANPTEAVDALREHLGRTRRIALALDIPFLFMKRVKLPPLPESEKREILRLEPERFFPVRAEEIVPAVRDDDDLVFATRETPLATWVAALEALGPVDGIEPGPLALARGLAQGRVPRSESERSQTSRGRWSLVSLVPASPRGGGASSGSRSPSA